MLLLKKASVNFNSNNYSTSHSVHRSYRQHILCIYRKPRGFQKAKPHLLFTRFHDRISRQLNPKELSGWSFHSWHEKHTDIDSLAANPSTFCQYTSLQHPCNSRTIINPIVHVVLNPTHYWLTGTAKRSSQMARLRLYLQ